jgi:urease accessory protein UreE
MGNKQQTAVEFYLDKVFDIIGDAILDKLSIEQINKIHDLSLQAKEMEKQRIETAYNKGTVHGIDYPESTLPITGEQYYEQTYGGGEQ